MKEYTVNDFQMKTYAYEPIVDTGRYSHGHWDINYSSVLTRLIQEAGRFCESYASDLFIDWEGVVNAIEDMQPNTEYTQLFGFRKTGIDHNAFIISRYESNGNSAGHEYRSLWRLDIKTTSDEITMTLGRVF